MRGFVRGLVWGTLAAAGGLVVASQVAGPVDPSRDAALSGDAPAAGVSGAASEAGAADGAVAGATGAGQDAAAVSEAQPVPEGAGPLSDAPDASAADGLSSDASDVSAATGPSGDAVDPGAVDAAPVGPGAVDAGAGDAASVDPGAVDAAPVGPADVDAAPVGPAPAEGADSPAASLPSSLPDAGQAGQRASAGQVGDAPVTPGEADAPQTAVAPQTPRPPAPEAAPAPSDPPPPPEAEALLLPLPQAEAPAAPAPAVVDPTPEPMAVPEPEADTGAETGADAAAGQATLAPAPALEDQVPGVVTGRLPRIGAEAEGGAPEADAAEAALELPPLRQFARPFDNPDLKPLFAILLQDDGQEGVDRAELAALELPLSIVIDPLSEGAAARAAIWRAGGQEVVMAGSGIPVGASPGDLEQSFQVLADRLPEAVAVIDADGQSFQGDRPLASQVVPILSAQGRGLVTFDQGLNAADQEARRAGLAAATVYRRIDGADEDSPVIRRYLDRAAFRAAQEGRVIVIGTLRPETVAGILEWAIEGRASTVALAPVSAMLQD